jgi:hypothetical protein
VTETPGSSEKTVMSALVTKWRQKLKVPSPSHPLKLPPLLRRYELAAEDYLRFVSPSSTKNHTCRVVKAVLLSVDVARECSGQRSAELKWMRT